jgi:hypothetical protein
MTLMNPKPEDERTLPRMNADERGLAQLGNRQLAKPEDENLTTDNTDETDGQLLIANHC